MNKAFLFGIFLYEGFVSKRSPQRNKRCKIHREELQVFLCSVNLLKNQNFNYQDEELLKTILKVVSTKKIKKYYPYSIKEIQRAIDENFINCSKISDNIWENINFSQILSVLTQSLSQVQKLSSNFFCFLKYDLLVKIYHNIHNLPRFLFPDQRPSKHLPFMGLKYNDFDLKNFKNCIKGEE